MNALSWLFIALVAAIVLLTVLASRRRSSRRTSKLTGTDRAQLDSPESEGLRNFQKGSVGGLYDR